MTTSVLEQTVGALRKLHQSGQVNNDTDYWTNPVYSSHRERHFSWLCGARPALSPTSWVVPSLALESNCPSEKLTNHGRVPASWVLISLILREMCPIGKLTSYGQRMPTFKEYLKIYLHIITLNPMVNYNFWFYIKVNSWSYHKFGEITLGLKSPRLVLLTDFIVYWS